MFCGVRITRPHVMLLFSNAIRTIFGMQIAEPQRPGSCLVSLPPSSITCIVQSRHYKQISPSNLLSSRSYDQQNKQSAQGNRVRYVRVKRGLRTRNSLSRHVRRCSIVLPRIKLEDLLYALAYKQHAFVWPMSTKTVLGM